MRFLKLNLFKKMKIKGYLFYAIGEIILIVLGILLALYINNRNISQQYKSQIDHNITRVFFELEKNIEDARNNIETLMNKDSLIHLVMNDSLKAEEYFQNLEFAALILNSHSLKLEDNAFQNLIKLNISDDKYKEDLLINLKELYSLNENIQHTNKLMSNFVFEKSAPLLAKSIGSFGNLTYSEQVNDDAVNFFINSKEYKSYLSLYTIIVIRNHLDNVRKFYKKSIKVYSQISEQYVLENKYEELFNLDRISNFTGLYFSEAIQDTIEIKMVDDSPYLSKLNEDGVFLIPFQKNRFFLDGIGQQRYFISFLENESDSVDFNLKFHLMSLRVDCEKIQ